MMMKSSSRLNIEEEEELNIDPISAVALSQIAAQVAHSSLILASHYIFSFSRLCNFFKYWGANKCYKKKVAHSSSSSSLLLLLSSFSSFSLSQIAAQVAHSSTQLNSDTIITRHKSDTDINSSTQFRQNDCINLTQASAFRRSLPLMFVQVWQQVMCGVHFLVFFFFIYVNGVMKTTFKTKITLSLVKRGQVW